jgi:hypothetical protein
MSGADAAVLVPLSQVVAGAPDDQEPRPGFMAQLDGADYTVVAVLQRTAVLEVPGDRRVDKRTARLDDVFVDAAVIAWGPKPPPAKYAAWRGRPRPAVAPAAQRAASDERARADQEPKRAVEAAAVRTPARPVAAVGRVRPEAGGLEGRARPADRPQQPAPDGQGAAPVAAAQTPDPTCRLAE